jgi:hypothetical protein
MQTTGVVPNIQAKINATNVASVGFYIDKELRHTEKNAPYCAQDLGESAGKCLGTVNMRNNLVKDGETTKTPLANGAHTLTVRATATNGTMIGEKSVVFYVASSNPTPVIPTPTPISGTCGGSN